MAVEKKVFVEFGLMMIGVWWASSLLSGGKCSSLTVDWQAAVGMVTPRLPDTPALTIINRHYRRHRDAAPFPALGADQHRSDFQRQRRAAQAAIFNISGDRAGT